MPVNGVSAEGENNGLHTEAKGEEACDAVEKVVAGDNLSVDKPGSDTPTENVTEKWEIPSTTEKKSHRIQIWTEIRPSLRPIEDMMSIRVKKKGNLSKDEQTGRGKPQPPTDESKSLKGASEEDSEDEFYDVEKSDPTQDGSSSDGVSTPVTGTTTADATLLESLFPWKEELEVLVRGGVPMALRGEVHQALLSSHLFYFFISPPMKLRT